MTRNQAPALLGLAAALLAAGCGAGVAGVVASSDSSGGGSTPALDAFVVESPKVSPCRLRLDASQAVRVALFYDRGAGERALTRLEGIAGNEVDLTAGETVLEWDFEDELGTASFTPGVRLMVKRGSTLISGGEITLGMGNDAPVVESALPPASVEVQGIVPVRLRVSDSSGDAVSIRAEYDVLGDQPDAGWRRARPGGLLPSEPTPDFAFVGQVAPSAPTELDFFWNTDVDLADLERDARLRFTAVDPAVVGSATETSTLHVDNNAAPIVQLKNDAVISNSDERRGIPIPFRVVDEEGDVVEVILQWRREGEEFPDLPSTDRAALDAVLADPEQRRAHQVCTPYPHFARGRVIPVDATTVRLPELAVGESWILASGLEGKTLELFRPSSIPLPISSTWRSNSFVAPVCAIPIGDGLVALVLEAVGGRRRLRRVSLATGEVLQDIAQLDGDPTAMALQRGGESRAIIALDLGTTWRLDEVDLADGAVREIYASDVVQPPPPVRGLASKGAHVVIVTVGSSLLQIDFREGSTPRAGVVRGDLATPWGVVLAPGTGDRAFVAERDFVGVNGTGRILEVDLSTHGTHPVAARSQAVEGLSGPTAIALDRDGVGLIVVTHDAVGTQLVGLSLGARREGGLFQLGASIAGEISSVARGSDGLIIAAIEEDNELLVGGGIEQRRLVVGYEAFDPTGRRGQVTRVDLPFEPLPTLGQGWRIAPDTRVRATASGVERFFTWDGGADLACGGRAFLRAIAMDNEPGEVSDGAARKRVRSGFDAEEVALGVGITSGARALTTLDLDGDGDVDLASANGTGNNLTVFYQESTRAFSTSPLVLGGSGITQAPVSLVAADLDGDGDVDLASANKLSNNVTVFQQESSGGFALSPLIIGDATTTQQPSSLVAADLDKDGSLDLATANQAGNNLRLFFQEQPGVFTIRPRALGDATSTLTPVSIAASDLDGDGDVDLASANLSSNSLTIFRQAGPGVFPRQPSFSGRITTPSSLALADVDTDGDCDLTTNNNSALAVFFQGLPGVFTSTPQFIASPEAVSPTFVTAADVDGDGDIDLASANLGQGFTGIGGGQKVFVQESPGAFAPSPCHIGGGGGYFAMVDVDGDGNVDLASASGGVGLVFQSSPGRYTSPPSVIEAIGGAPYLVAADLDGDSDFDLGARYFDGGVAVLSQQSPGDFVRSTVSEPGAGIVAFDYPLVAADLDSDGDLDLATTDVESCNLDVFLQTSTGTFGAPFTLGDVGGLPLCAETLLSEDIDLDGDRDLASSSFSRSILAVYFQEGPGVFSTLAIGGPGTTGQPGALAVGDFDGDGNFDLVSANEASDSLTVFKQEPLGLFSTMPVILAGPDTPGQETRSLLALDLDGDRDTDIIAADGSSIATYTQGPPGAFVMSTTLLENIFGPIAASDLDGDNDVDLIVPGVVNCCSLALFSQESPGVFASTPQVLASGFFSTFVLATDLDGDGDMDITSTGTGALTVHWGGR